MAREDRYLQLADIAANQWGLITTAQARQAQVNAQQIARLSTRGVLIRMQHGVYRLAGVPHDPMAGLKAAWLALQPEITARERLHRADPGAVASHRSAASLHHLGELDADVHEFTIAQRRRTRHRDVRLHVRVLNLDEWQVVDDLPVTTVAVTIADLARLRTDGKHLGSALRDALGHHLVGDEIAEVLRRFAHLYGAPLGDGNALVASLLQQAGVTLTAPSVTASGAQPALHSARGGPQSDVETSTQAEHVAAQRQTTLHTETAEAAAARDVGRRALAGAGHAAARRIATEAASRAATRRHEQGAAEAAARQAAAAAARAPDRAAAQRARADDSS